MKRVWLVLLGCMLAGLAVFYSRPGSASAGPLVQAVSATPSATLSTGTPEDLSLTPGTPTFPPEPTMSVSPGPDLFRTEDAAILDSFATPAGSQTLPATRTPTVTRTATVTPTPTATATATATFTPSPTGPTPTNTATITVTPTITLTPTPGPRPQAMDWKMFGLGFSFPLLAAVAAAVVVLLKSRKG